MAQIIDLNTDGDTREPIDVALGQLAIGNLVLVPEESGWAIVGLSSHPMAGQKLADISDEHPAWLQVVAVDHPEVLHDYMPPWSLLQSRLVSRCWPGPVVLGLDRDPTSLDSAWPEASRNWASRGEQRRWIVPADETFRALAAAAPAPLLALIPRPSEASIPPGIGERASIALVGVEPRYEAPPTVVRVAASECRVEEPGVLQESTLQRLGGVFILFVCTGNTCRSPMAEALFRKMLAERLKCAEDELLDRGYVVLSAGISAYRGGAASPEGVALLHELDGIDLSFHESQPVTEQLLQQADRVLTMTSGHLESILAAFPEHAAKTRTLAPNGADIPDPIGGSLEDYRRCRATIVHYLGPLVDEILA